MELLVLLAMVGSEVEPVGARGLETLLCKKGPVWPELELESSREREPEDRSSRELIGE